MTEVLSPEEYTRLPGPGRTIVEIVADLNAGRSVIIVFPDHLVEDGIADAVLDEIHTFGTSAPFCVATDSEPFPARILTTFGGDPVTDRDYDNWETIIDWRPWHGSWVLMAGWEHSDIATIVNRWPPQIHASGLALTERPKLVIGVRISDVERKAVTRLDRDTVAVHWWWGILDRLDTETRLTALVGRTLNPVDAAVIT